nr:probable calcium-binding protein CML50 [Aegilops tauschii subsp. strangulata]
MVQAWPMPWRALGAGVLGPRPGVPQQQAFFAGGAPPAPHPYGYGYGGYPALLPGSTYGSPGPSSSNAPSPPQPPWDMGGLQSALQVAHTSSSPPTRTSDWYMDSGASSHMTSNPGTLHSLHPSFPPRDIIIGNGGRMPITHTAHGYPHPPGDPSM